MARLGSAVVAVGAGLLLLALGLRSLFGSVGVFGMFLFLTYQKGSTRKSAVTETV
jgi:hypothetical protein